ncbi:MAG: hypothetical protein ACK4MD_11290 [Demequina sp.]
MLRSHSGSQGRTEDQWYPEPIRTGLKGRSATKWEQLEQSLGR